MSDLPDDIEVVDRHLVDSIYSLALLNGEKEKAVSWAMIHVNVSGASAEDLVRLAINERFHRADISVFFNDSGWGGVGWQGNIFYSKSQELFYTNYDGDWSRGIDTFQKAVENFQAMQDLWK